MTRFLLPVLLVTAAGCASMGGSNRPAGDPARDMAALPPASASMPPRVTPPVMVTAEASGTVKWILPGPRELDEGVFGTPDRPLGWQESVGVPLDQRVVENGRYARTTMPTAHSDKTQPVSGDVRFTVHDVSAVDGRQTEDTVDFEATFTNPAGDRYRVVVTKPIPMGPNHSFFGGVLTNTFLHGSTGLGTMLQPQQFVYAGFWGVGDLYRDGQKVADNQVVHVMLSQRVRTSDADGYRLVFTPQVDEMKGMGRQIHVILPPQMVTPSGPEMRPVPTGFTLPNGEMQPFVHLMFDDVTRVESESLR